MGVGRLKIPTTLESIATASLSILSLISTPLRGGMASGQGPVGSHYTVVGSIPEEKHIGPEVSTDLLDLITEELRGGEIRQAKPTTCKGTQHRVCVQDLAVLIPQRAMGGATG